MKTGPDRDEEGRELASIMATGTGIEVKEISS